MPLRGHCESRAAGRAGLDRLQTTAGLRGAAAVEAEEVGEDSLIDLGAAGGEGVVGRQGPAGAGVGPDIGEVLAPVPVGVGRGVGGQDGAVEFGVGQPQPGGAAVAGLLDTQREKSWNLVDRACNVWQGLVRNGRKRELTNELSRPLDN